MKKILTSISFITIIAIFFNDLNYQFGNYDTPFLWAFSVYFLWVLIFRITSRVTFFIILVLVVGMGISFVQNGSIRFTERIGEWLYLFFIFGLIQYFREVFHER